MRVLGIDPGTRLVGYGVVEVVGDVLRYVECGVLRASSEAELSMRVHELARGVVEIIRELAPQQVAMEAAFHGANAASALKLAEARGALREVCMQNGLGVSEYPPATVKRMVVGRGRATKADVQARVALVCRLRREPAVDAADALALAICHAQGLMGPAVPYRRAGA